jgi:hypothetical protein
MSDVLFLLGIFIVLYTIGDFLTCYFMLTPNTTWCERFL